MFILLILLYKFTTNLPQAYARLHKGLYVLNKEQGPYRPHSFINVAHNQIISIFHSTPP